MFISLFGLFENIKPLVIAESVTGLSSRTNSSHSLPLLQLSPCERRTCQVTVLTEEPLYMRPNLGYVRKAGRLSMSLTYDRTGGGTQECSIQYPQCWYSVGCKRVKWGVEPHETKG